jgi:hypothetical protein
VFVAEGWTCGAGTGGDLIARREQGASQ